MNTVLVVLSVAIILAQVDSHPIPAVIIRNSLTQLVLDGENNVVTVENANGEESQAWQLVSSGTGTFYIQNKATENVIEKEEDGEGAITNKLIEGEKKQQWYFGFHRTIVNAASGQVLHVELENLSSGHPVLVHDYTHKKNQFFDVKHA